MAETPEFGCRLEQDPQVPAGQILLCWASGTHPRPLVVPKRFRPGSPSQVPPGASVTQ